jgi:hypothetical protein
MVVTGPCSAVSVHIIDVAYSDSWDLQSRAHLIPTEVSVWDLRMNVPEVEEAGLTRHVRSESYRAKGASWDRLKFQLELEILDCFVRLLGYIIFSFPIPMAGQKTDSGADVSLTLDGRRYGIQVTKYHSDGGMRATGKGGFCGVKKRERRRRSRHTRCAAIIPIGSSCTPNYGEVQKRCSPTAFEELILLIGWLKPCVRRHRCTLHLHQDVLAAAYRFARRRRLAGLSWDLIKFSRSRVGTICHQVE